MPKLHYVLILTVAAICGLSACATSDRPNRTETLAQLVDDPRTGEEVERICFRRGIDSFNNESRYSVVLRRGVNDEYLVVTRACPNLEIAQSIAIEASSGCLRRQDFLQVFTSAFGPSSIDGPTQTRCLIDRIYRWNADATTAEMASEDVESDE